MKKVFAICGSTRINSSNLQLLNAIKDLYIKQLDIEIYTSLHEMPHFNPDIQDDAIPSVIQHFRNSIKIADGVLICTPEYVFSLPGVLKNAIEWTIATTVFSEKPLALITASGLGQKAHESLLLIMKTIYASYTEETQLLISGARTKVSDNRITDNETLLRIQTLMNSFIILMNNAKLDLHSSKALQ
jgi:chromate reductase